MLSAQDRAVFDEVRPSRPVWEVWLRARRSTVDPAGEYFGWPLHVALVWTAWDAAAAAVKRRTESLGAALARSREAVARRDRRARAYRALIAEAGPTWTVVSTAMAEYSAAADRALAACLALQREKLGLDRALWWAEALMRSGLLGEAFAHMHVARRALETIDETDWHADPPPELPPMPAASLPPLKAVPLRRGPFAVLRQTSGAWIVVDDRRPTGDREVFRSPWLREANDELTLRAQSEGVPLDA